MKKKRNLVFLWRQLFCLLMAFYVINVSIDAPDGYVTPSAFGEYQEDLSINEIESIGELLLEEIFGIQDAFPEHDEPEDEESQTQLTKIFFDWSIPGSLACYQFPQTVEYRSTETIPFVSDRYFSKPAEVTTPPPRIG